MSENSILVIEDSPDDCFVMQRTFKKAKLQNQVAFLHDGDEAIDYLYHKGSYSDSANYPRPGLLLLDLNLPKTDGREILQRVKADNELKNIPVVVLSTSTDPKDKMIAHEQGAIAYLTKPFDIIDLCTVIETMAIPNFKLQFAT